MTGWEQREGKDYKGRKGQGRKEEGREGKGKGRDPQGLVYTLMFEILKKYSD